MTVALDGEWSTSERWETSTQYGVWIVACPASFSPRLPGRTSVVASYQRRSSSDRRSGNVLLIASSHPLPSSCSDQPLVTSLCSPIVHEPFRLCRVARSAAAERKVTSSACSIYRCRIRRFVRVSPTERQFSLALRSIPAFLCLPARRRHRLPLLRAFPCLQRLPPCYERRWLSCGDPASRSVCEAISHDGGRPPALPALANGTNTILWGHRSEQHLATATRLPYVSPVHWLRSQRTA